MIRLNLVIYLNGVPGSGKDELVQYLRTHFPARVHNVSSIDCVRELLNIPASDKRDATRQVLSEVGAILERYSEFRSARTAYTLLHMMESRVTNDPSPHVYFVHTRETSMGMKISQRLLNYFENTVHPPGAVRTTSLFIDRPEVALTPEAYSNDSDREAATSGRENAQHILNNDGTLAQLYERGATLLTELIREYSNATVNLPAG